MMKSKPRMPVGYWQHLADSNPIGMQLTAQDAEAWFDMVWLRYRMKTYRRHQQAITNWWSRISRREIEQARERAALILNERENEELEARAVRESQQANASRVDHFARLTSNG